MLNDPEQRVQPAKANYEEYLDVPQLFNIHLTAVSSFQYLIAECVHYSRHGGCTVAVTEAAAQMHDPGGPGQMGLGIPSL